MSDQPPPYSKNSGYAPVPPAYPQQQQATTVAAPSTVLVAGPLMGVCPNCQVGILEDDYPVLAWCLALCFFPLGVLCCLAMRQKRCTTCGAVFDV